MRARAALGLGKRLILATVRESKVKTRFNGTTAGIDINSALFDQLRDPATIPMRAFYASAIDRLLAHCAVDADVTVTNDQPGAWSLAITVRGPRQLEAMDAAVKAERPLLLPSACCLSALSAQRRCRPDSRAARPSSSCRSRTRRRKRASRGCARARRSCSARRSRAVGRDRRRSRGAPAGVRSPAAAGERDAEPRLDDQGRPGGRRLVVVSGTVAMQGDQLVARARVVRLDYRPAAAGCRSARAAVGSVRRVRCARAAEFARRRRSVAAGRAIACRRRRRSSSCM